jgi:hypothetical protein
MQRLSLALELSNNSEPADCAARLAEVSYSHCASINRHTSKVGFEPFPGPHASTRAISVSAKSPQHANERFRRVLAQLAKIALSIQKTAPRRCLDSKT